MRVTINPCFCGASPEHVRESTKEHAFVCPNFYYTPDDYKPSKEEAAIEWNDWVKNPRSEDDDECN